MGSGLTVVSAVLLLAALAGCLGDLQNNAPPASAPDDPSPTDLPDEEEPSRTKMDADLHEPAKPADEGDPITSDRYYLVRPGMIRLENRPAEEPTQVPFVSSSPYSYIPPVVRAGPWVYHFQDAHEITGVEATLWVRASNPVVLAAPSSEEGGQCGFLMAISIGNDVDGFTRHTYCSDLGDGILYPGDQRLHLSFPPADLTTGPTDRMTVRLFAQFYSGSKDDLVVLGGAEAFDSHVRLIGAEEVVHPASNDTEAAAEPVPEVQPDPGPDPETTDDGATVHTPDGRTSETETIAVGVVLATSVFAALGRIAFKIGRYRILQWVFACFLFTRLTREKVLDHERRAALFEVVRESPGITFSELRRRSRLGSGTLLHHLRVLEKQGLVRCVRDGVRSRFYEHGAAIDGGPYLNQVQRGLEKAIRKHPGATQKQLSHMLGLPRQSLHYHAKRMEALGSIRIRRDGRCRRHYPA